MKASDSHFRPSVFIQVVVVIAFVCTCSLTLLAQSRKQVQKVHVERMLNEKNFTFVAEYVGSGHRLVKNYYYVTINPDSLTSCLMYPITEAHTYTYSSYGHDYREKLNCYDDYYNKFLPGAQGMQNTAYHVYYQVDSTQRSKYIVRIAPRDNPLHPYYVLTVNANGNAFMAVYLKNSLISYYDGLVTDEPEKLKERILY